MDKSKIKVCVGLSGGVDSSVAAYLLKQEGYDVFAMFMQNWHDADATLHGDCEWEEDRFVAELVARKIGIPFYFVDLSGPYRQRVVDYMFDEYAKGRTPNPDVLCNREIKFDAFLAAAKRLGADYVATGHYVRKVAIPSLPGMSGQSADSAAEAVGSGGLRSLRSLRPLPQSASSFYYSYGVSVINSHLIKGATILLTEGTVAQREFWNFMKEQKATSMAGVPYTYEMLKRLRFFRMDLPYLKTMTQAGGKLNKDIAKEYIDFAAANGKKFYVMYGQTEATARMSYLPWERSYRAFVLVNLQILCY